MSESFTRLSSALSAASFGERGCAETVNMFVK